MYSAIAEEIANQGLRTNLGATPANSVNSVISRSRNELGTKSPFVRTGRGMYFLSDDFLSQNHSKQRAVIKDDRQDRPIINSLGMFWRSEEVFWKSNPKLLGQQQAGADPVDFSPQLGVYLLHDRERVIYVGRSIDRPLGQRLFEHTKDRLNGRWDRFSWFGMKSVNDDGSLEKLDARLTEPSNIIATLEAVLIEALEPPLNRKRGDQLSAIEYLQARDPEKDRDKEAILEFLIRSRK